MKWEIHVQDTDAFILHSVTNDSALVARLGFECSCDHGPATVREEAKAKDLCRLHWRFVVRFFPPLAVFDGSRVDSFTGEERTKRLDTCVMGGLSLLDKDAIRVLDGQVYKCTFRYFGADVTDCLIRLQEIEIIEELSSRTVTDGAGCSEVLAETRILGEEFVKGSNLISLQLLLISIRIQPSTCSESLLFLDLLLLFCL